VTPKAKVLIVDDEPSIRELCARILGSSYDVDTAPDGMTAVRMASASAPDLLLADLRMPGMSGLDAARRIVADAPEVSVVIMTGFSQFDSLLETVRFGVNGFVLKPFTPDDLRRTVEDGLRRGQYFKRTARLRSLAPLLDLREGQVSGDPTRIFQTICETVLRELDADSVTLFALDEDGQEVALTSSVVAPDAEPVTVTRRPGDVDWIAPTASRIETGNGNGNGSAPHDDGRTLSMPLRTGGTVVGALTVKRADGPFTATDRDLLRLICAQSSIAIENIRLFTHLRQSYWNTVYALAATVDLRDHPTRGHSDRLAQYAVAIGTRLGLKPDRLDDLKIAALLHDIGKIGINDGVLLKPGDLTSEEYDQMKTHTLMGAKILAMAGFSPRVVEAVLFHHEWYDGSGYPLGLRSDQIPLEARILTGADALESMTSPRMYRDAMPVAAAVSELVDGRGTQFDPQIIDALLACLESGEFHQSLAGVHDSLQLLAETH
jgi:putative nucleotidyltransferase with HDIG domain